MSKIEFQFDGFTINALNQRGGDYGVQIRYDNNMTSIQRQVDSTNVITRLKGRGQDGLTVEGLDVSNLSNEELTGFTWELQNGKKIITKDYIDSLIINNYAYPKEGIKEWNDVDDQKVLFEKMKVAIQDVELPDISYTISFVELARQGIPFSDVNLGDFVTIVDTSMAINVKARVVEIEKNPLVIEASTATLETKRRNIIDYLNEIKSTKDLVVNNSDQVAKKFDILEKAINNATQILNGINSKIVFTDEAIFCFQKDTLGANDSILNTTKLLKIANGAIGISTDGGNNYRTAMTPDGVNADTIIGNLLIGRVGQFENLIIVDDNNNALITLGKYTSPSDTTEKTGMLVNSGAIEFTGRLPASALPETLLIQGENYSNCKIDSEVGFQATRNDNKLRVSMNAIDGFKIEKGDGTGNTWLRKMYADEYGNLYVDQISTNNIKIMSDGATLLDAENKIFDLSKFTTIVGKLTGSNVDGDTISIPAMNITGQLNADQIYTKFIQSANANINRLTVDHLLTNDSEQGEQIQYVDARENWIKLMEGTRKKDNNGDYLPDIQLTDEDNNLLFWTDENMTVQTTTATSYPVMVHQYNTLAKMKLYFTSDVEPGVNVPVIELGAGDGDADGNSNDAKGYIYKGVQGLYIKYISSAGKVRQIIMDDDGIRFETEDGIIDTNTGIPSIAKFG